MGNVQGRTVQGESRHRVCRRQHARAERGQIVVLFALLLPVFLALGAIVIDVGNWYVHKKHLQTMVDAGALAGAPKFVGCSFQFGDPASANNAIREVALEYSGDPSRDPATRNRQHQEPDDIHVLLNSTRYWQPGDPTSGAAIAGLDFTWDIDGDGGGGDPCSERSLDVKATDEDVPLLWGLLPLFPDIKARARVEVTQIVEQNGMLPWAVPEVEPAAVAAVFVDESSGDVIAAQRLESRDDPTLPFHEWVTPGMDWRTDPPTEVVPNASRVDLASENTGVVILVAKVNPFPSGATLDLSGSLTQICGQAPGIVSCYAGDGSQDGLTFIHGWNDENGSPAVPVIRDVRVLDVNCEDLSAPYFLRTGDCDLGVEAVIDFGTDPLFDPATADVFLDAPGCGQNGCRLSYDGQGAVTGESVWIGFGARFPDDFFGRSTFSIDVATEFPVGTDNQRTFTGVAHPYVAEPADLQGNQAPPGAGAGPVEYLVLSSVDPVLDANTRNRDDPPLASVVVTVGLQPPFQIQSPLEEPVVLRVASPSGSQNQAFDCDRPFNFSTEIQNGCATTYRENYGDWDGDGDKEWSDLLCADYPNGAGLPPDTFTPAPPEDCVRIETGDKVGQFRQGINQRLMTPSCAPNNWPDSLSDFSDFYTNHDFVNDPRYVTLVVTDFGTFLGQGSSSAVPVKYFAGFYITGWDKTGNNPPCADNDPHPWYSPGYRKSLDNGDVWGHFINVVAFSASGTGSDDLCNFDEVGTCLIGLVE
ncbi:MAG TPA: Tad domain-containing protein [Gaiellaceae bacterium]|nr:Tad domain-containing protein [Gaiellaceae bacterium]